MWEDAEDTEKVASDAGAFRAILVYRKGETQKPEI